MHENGELTQDHFELLGVELRPEHLFDVYGVATFEVENCECTSTQGEQQVTERWQEFVLKDVLVLELYYLAGDNNDTPSPIPTSLLTEADISLIEDIVPTYEP